MKRVLRGRRRRIFGGLFVVWLVITVVDLTVKIPGPIVALLWISIFATSVAASVTVLPAAWRYYKRVRERPGIDLGRLLGAESYVVREATRLSVSVALLLTGVFALINWSAPTVSLFFLAGLGMLGNTLADREERRDQARLLKAELEDLDKKKLRKAEADAQ